MKPITSEWVEKAENDWGSLHREIRARKNPNYDAAGFFAEQCVEKYIKARLVEADIYFKKVHDLTYLLELVKPIEPMWASYEEELRILTDYAVEFRYPGATADLETAKLALRFCKSFRTTARFGIGRIVSMPKPPPNSVHLKSRAGWRKWLEKNHTRNEGVWLISYKKATGKPRVDYDESVEEALCFGWIDSKGNKLDDERSMLWFVPRKAGTGWSKLNKERIEKLVKAKLMSPVGLAKVNAAKKDASWNALDSVEALEIPSDLAEALSKNVTARGYFEALPRSVKRALLEWISNAKRPETRAKRIEETVTKAAQNIRANQWRQ